MDRRDARTQSGSGLRISGEIALACAQTRCPTDTQIRAYVLGEFSLEEIEDFAALDSNNVYKLHGRNLIGIEGEFDCAWVPVSGSSGPEDAPQA